MSATPVEPAATAIRRLLSSHGPMHTYELINALTADGILLGASPEDRLHEVLDEDTEVIVALADGRLAWLPGLLQGRVFTHRLRELEATHDFLDMGPDLASVTILTESEDHLRLVDGSSIVEVGRTSGAELLGERGLDLTDLEHDEAWLLPPGYLAGLGVEAGDLVGVRVTEDGFELIAVEALTKSTVIAAIAARLGEQPERPETIAVSVWMACDKHKDAFREPIAPLGELLRAMGLAVEGEWVAPAGFDFELWRSTSRIGDIMTVNDLHVEEATAVWTALVLHERVQAAPGQVDFDTDTLFMDARDALDFFEEPIVVEAFLSEVSSTDDFSATTLETFARTFEKIAPRAARPAMLWLQGRAHEHVGEIDRAEQAFRAAETLDASWPLSLLSLARIASDRGQAERGLSLLLRAGTLPDAPLLQMLEAFQPTQHPTPARNQPCWCGSGRKYKQCHLHREQLPLGERAAWLYQKAVTDMLAGPSASLLTDVAYERCADGDSPEALEQAFADPFARDVVLFEGGAFDDFLALRGSLLPPDEAQMAELWLDIERSVHEVLTVQDGQSIILRDVRTGEVQEVWDTMWSRQVQPGELYCARVVPAGETMQILGGLEPVTPDESENLLALLAERPDPVDLVAFLSGHTSQD
ncbi:SEC-C domain-containing protein [Tessaracoccus sp.]